MMHKRQISALTQRALFTALLHMGAIQRMVGMAADGESDFCRGILSRWYFRNASLESFFIFNKEGRGVGVSCRFNLQSVTFN